MFGHVIDTPHMQYFFSLFLLTASESSLQNAFLRTMNPGGDGFLEVLVSQREACRLKEFTMMELIVITTKRIIPSRTSPSLLLRA